MGFDKFSSLIDVANITDVANYGPALLVVAGFTIWGAGIAWKLSRVGFGVASLGVQGAASLWRKWRAFGELAQAILDKMETSEISVDEKGVSCDCGVSVNLKEKTVTVGDLDAHHMLTAREIRAIVNKAWEKVEKQRLLSDSIAHAMMVEHLRKAS